MAGPIVIAEGSCVKDGGGLAYRGKAGDTTVRISLHRFYMFFLD